MGVLRRMHQPKLNRRQRLSSARRVGLRKHLPFCRRKLGLLTGRVRNMQEFPGQWPMTPEGIGLVRRADLSIKPRSGCGVLLAEAGHDPGKCVRPELIERGG